MPKPTLLKPDGGVALSPAQQPTYRRVLRMSTWPALPTASTPTATNRSTWTWTWT